MICLYDLRYIAPLFRLAMHHSTFPGQIPPKAIQVVTRSRPRPPASYLPQQKPSLMQPLTLHPSSPRTRPPEAHRRQEADAKRPRPPHLDPKASLDALVRDKDATQCRRCSIPSPAHLDCAQNHTGHPQAIRRHGIRRLLRARYEATLTYTLLIMTRLPPR